MMSKKVKIIFVSLIVIAVVGLLGYNYVMHGGERNLTTEKTDFTVTSADITAEFTKNIDASNKKYLEKAVAITGIITSVNATEVIIDNTIICNLKKLDSSTKKGQTVTVKGRIVGYDDLMGELKLDQCFIIINN
ncbi:hypothetical protein [Flavobacterium sp. AED]|uniref:OB-fold protein n=1 Tax=Flavobacterium sp. AED TaxID=1423323 RepID=UPI00057EA588|nr:hypothetical protein [Flavobacterium sp. AED]KIA85542.1 hypothetical protein OA85_09620 [Flavobacterium sp. AED]MDI1304260.1 hypothetical protein [bacterium]